MITHYTENEKHIFRKFPHRSKSAVAKGRKKKWFKMPCYKYTELSGTAQRIAPQNINLPRTFR